MLILPMVFWKSIVFGTHVFFAKSIVICWVNELPLESKVDTDKCKYIFTRLHDSHPYILIRAGMEVAKQRPKISLPHKTK